MTLEIITGTMLAIALLFYFVYALIKIEEL